MSIEELEEEITSNEDNEADVAEGTLDVKKIVAKTINISVAKNVQRDTRLVTGVKSSLSQAKEFAIVTTTDEAFHQLYADPTPQKIFKDLCKAGEVRYHDIAGKKKDAYVEAIDGLLISAYEDDFEHNPEGNPKSIAYSREELVQDEGRLGIVHDELYHHAGENRASYRYLDKSTKGIASSVGSVVGNVNEFVSDLSKHLSGHVMIQLILAYLLSGAVKQALYYSSDSVGEYGAFMSLTGESGSGKSIVTSTLSKMLFAKSAEFNRNITSIARMNIIRNSGIAPVLLDDASTITKRGSDDHLIADIYHIASGKARITAFSDKEVPLFAPYLETREEGYSMVDAVKGNLALTGFVYRTLEVYCRRGDLTDSAEDARELDSLSKKYKGMAVPYLDYLVDHYTADDVNNLYKNYITEIKDDLDENDLDERYANRAAVILTTAQIAEEAYGLQMNLQEIKKLIVQSFYDFKERLNGVTDTPELRVIYDFITAQDKGGEYVNSKYIAADIHQYRHQHHYVCLLEKNPQQIYIPVPLMGVLLDAILFNKYGAEGFNLEPRYFGYGKDNLHLEWTHKIGQSRWQSLLKQWSAQGILLVVPNRKSYQKTRILDNTKTQVYHFDFRMICKYLGQNFILEPSRYYHDTPEESAVQETYATTEDF